MRQNPTHEDLRIYNLEVRKFVTFAFIIFLFITYPIWFFINLIIPIKYFWVLIFYELLAGQGFDEHFVYWFLPDEDFEHVTPPFTCCMILLAPNIFDLCIYPLFFIGGNLYLGFRENR